MADLAKLAIWELRQPLDARQALEVENLEHLLQAHAATFTTVTGIPAEVVRHGSEPTLPAEVRGRLFAIAHNALTNAFRHAQAGRIEIGLEFGAQHTRVSIQDDGTGLPEDYRQRGHGFRNMQADAEAIGGTLEVEPRGPLGGAAVSCLVPRQQAR